MERVKIGDYKFSKGEAFGEWICKGGTEWSKIGNKILKRRPQFRGAVCEWNASKQIDA